MTNRITTTKLKRYEPRGKKDEETGRGGVRDYLPALILLIPFISIHIIDHGMPRPSTWQQWFLTLLSYGLSCGIIFILGLLGIELAKALRRMGIIQLMEEQKETINNSKEMAIFTCGIAALTLLTVSIALINA